MSFTTCYKGGCVSSALSANSSLNRSSFKTVSIPSQRDSLGRREGTGVERGEESGRSSSSPSTSRPLQKTLTILLKRKGGRRRRWWWRGRGRRTFADLFPRLWSHMYNLCPSNVFYRSQYIIIISCSDEMKSENEVSH